MTETRFALVTGVDPMAYFVVEYCDETVTVTGPDPYTLQLYSTADPTCAAGSTCSGSGAMYPVAAHTCVYATNAVFLDSQLEVSCGSKTSNYAAGGTLTSSSDTTYSSVSLIH